MSKTIAVTGATGSQGGGVVNIMRKTPGWSVRAITRNPTSEAAKKLAAAGVEVVQASFDDEIHTSGREPRAGLVHVFARLPTASGNRRQSISSSKEFTN